MIAARCNDEAPKTSENRTAAASDVVMLLPQRLPRIWLKSPGYDEVPAGLVRLIRQNSSVLGSVMLCLK
jgi:hypothetical protein